MQRFPQGLVSHQSPRVSRRRVTTCVFFLGPPESGSKRRKSRLKSKGKNVRWKVGARRVRESLRAEEPRHDGRFTAFGGKMISAFKGGAVGVD